MLVYYLYITINFNIQHIFYPDILCIYYIILIPFFYNFSNYKLPIAIRKCFFLYSFIHKKNSNEIIKTYFKM